MNVLVPIFLTLTSYTRIIARTSLDNWRTCRVYKQCKSELNPNRCYGCWSRCCSEWIKRATVEISTARTRNINLSTLSSTHIKSIRGLVTLLVSHVFLLRQNKGHVAIPIFLLSLLNKLRAILRRAVGSTNRVPRLGFFTFHLLMEVYCNLRPWHEAVVIYMNTKYTHFLI
jgi:hypothetical protein